MKVELHSNGRLVLRLKPETPIEMAFVDTMLAAAEKGTTVKLERPANEPATMALTMEV